MAAFCLLVLHLHPLESIPASRKQEMVGRRAAARSSGLSVPSFTSVLELQSSDSFSFLLDRRRASAVNKLSNPGLTGPWPEPARPPQPYHRPSTSRAVICRLVPACCPRRRTSTFGPSPSVVPAHHPVLLGTAHHSLDGLHVGGVGHPRCRRQGSIVGRKAQRAASAQCTAFRDACRAYTSVSVRCKLRHRMGLNLGRMTVSRYREVNGGELGWVYADEACCDRVGSVGPHRWQVDGIPRCNPQPRQSKHIRPFRRPRVLLRCGNAVGASCRSRLLYALTIGGRLVVVNPSKRQLVNDRAHGACSELGLNTRSHDS